MPPKVSEQRYQITCEECGEEYLARAPWKKLCGRAACQVSRWRRRRREEAAKQGTPTSSDKG